MSIEVKNILQGVQDAFAKREKGQIFGNAKGSGEAAIANYFKDEHGIEIGVDNEAKKIASTDKKVTEENLKALLNSREFKEADKAAAEKQAAATKIQSVFRGNKGREEAKLQPSSMNIVAIPEKLKMATPEQAIPLHNTDFETAEHKANFNPVLSELTQKAEKQAAEKQAAVQEAIVKAYNTSKGKGVDEFVKEFFGKEAISPDLEKEAKEIFEDINRYYRGSTIKDLNQIMSDKPGFAERLQDFAIKCVRILPNLFGAGIKTNSEVRSDFKIKSEAIDKKSFLEHAAKKDPNLAPSK